MDIIKVKDCIEKLIVEVGHCRREIEAKGQKKAEAIRNYDKRMAITLANLRHSENYTLNNKTYNAPPVTILEKIAKGLCAQASVISKHSRRNLTAINQFTDIWSLYENINYKYRYDNDTYLKELMWYQPHLSCGKADCKAGGIKDQQA